MHQTLQKARCWVPPAPAAFTGEEDRGCQAWPRGMLGTKAARLLEPALSLQVPSTGGKKGRLRWEGAAGTPPQSSCGTWFGLCPRARSRLC